ncbi:MAG: PTS sugar transporter subunit IIA [Acidiferrobacterales bacterium]
MQIHNVLTPKRIAAHMRVSSKKRMLEQICALLRTDEVGLDANAAFQSLVDRERLGTTAVGYGVALPHGRLKGLRTAVGAFATLADEVECDALDRRPVKMVFALLIPENASPEHLKLLPELVAVFSNERLREQLLDADSPNEIYDVLASYNGIATPNVG